MRTRLQRYKLQNQKVNLRSDSRVAAEARSQSPSKISNTIRASEWWEFKLPPMFAALYATAFMLGAPISSLWRLLLLALVALVPGAAYVSVINDFTDMQDDIDSGKNNRLIGRSSTFIAFSLICCVVPGIAMSIYWRNDPVLLSLYLAAWLSFSLYSIPPARLKNRGALGPLADASGAHLFPTLLVVFLVYRRLGFAPDPLWIAAVAVWSFSFGLRGILWHQLRDAKNDEKIGLTTFVRNRTVTQLSWLGNWVIFPLELAGLATILWLTGSKLAIAFLAFYALVEWARVVRWKMNIVTLIPKDRYSIAMLEYYEVLLPLSFLLSSSLQHPMDAIVVVAHVLLFPSRLMQLAKDVLKLLKQAVSDVFRQRRLG